MIEHPHRMELITIVIVALLLILLPICGGATDPEEPLVIHPNQFFVEIDSLATIDGEELDGILSDLNCTEVWREEDLNMSIWEVNSFPFTTPDGESILDINGAITASRKKVKIRSASLNIQQNIVSHTVNQSEASCFDIANYNIEQGTETIKISILDTGISDITDNAGTTGYNYNLSTYTGYDYVNNDHIPDDEHGHGSHLAGLMHSITHQSVPNPSEPSIIYDIRKTHDANGQAFMSAVVMALIDAKKEDVDIVNMSFSVNDNYHDTLFYPLKNVIDWLETEGILVIAAAGNDFLDNDNMVNTALPASFPSANIISVSSTNCHNELSSFSNFGAQGVDIATLGEGIPGPNLEAGVICLSGTSQAAAIVTALSALHASRQIEFDYNLTKCAFLSSTTHYVNLGDVVLSDGLLNIYDALTTTSCPEIGDDCEMNFTLSNALSGPIVENSIFETSLSIESSQTIRSNQHLSYDAGMSITLLSGFEVGMGASLRISTDGCKN